MTAACFGPADFGQSIHVSTWNLILKEYQIQNHSSSSKVLLSISHFFFCLSSVSPFWSSALMQSLSRITQLRHFTTSNEKKPNHIPRHRSKLSLWTDTLRREEGCWLCTPDQDHGTLQKQLLLVLSFLHCTLRWDSRFLMEGRLERKHIIH